MKKSFVWRLRHRLVLVGLGMMCVGFLALGVLRSLKGSPVLSSVQLPFIRGGAVDGSEVAPLYSFLLKMDSLRDDPSGRFVYDSLCRVRPGLVDSVRLAIRIYSFRKFYK